jgi:glutamate synthase domain-containing protein 3
MLMNAGGIIAQRHGRCTRGEGKGIFSNRIVVLPRYNADILIR